MALKRHPTQLAEDEIAFVQDEAARNKMTFNTALRLVLRDAMLRAKFVFRVALPDDLPPVLPTTVVETKVKLPVVYDDTPQWDEATQQAEYERQRQRGLAYDWLQADGKRYQTGDIEKDIDNCFDGVLPYPNPEAGDMENYDNAP